jgi:type IV fimbrial biogenesis protein FimT
MQATGWRKAARGRKAALGRDAAITAERGFTVIELMLTVLVSSILVAMAVPAFNTFVLNDRDVGQINSLVTSFNYARSEAIKQHLSAGVSVCPSTDGITCNGTPNWGGGWIVLNNDPSLAGTPQAVVEYIPSLAGANTLTASLAGASGLVFQYNGTVNSPVSIKICDTRGSAFARDVEVNATGRIASSQTAGQSVAGAALTCP